MVNLWSLKENFKLSTGLMVLTLKDIYGMHSMTYSGLIDWFGIIPNGGVPNLNTQVGYFVQVTLSMWNFCSAER
jgi:hypothetical protein